MFFLLGLAPPLIFRPFYSRNKLEDTSLVISFTVARMVDHTCAVTLAL